MADSKRRLATRVSVAGTWYGPDDDIPDDVAERITNPNAWADDGDADATAASQPRSTTGARLATRVSVGGEWYGPDDDVPDDVARRITNPNAWEGGTLPTLAAEEEPAPEGGGEGATAGAQSTADDTGGGAVKGPAEEDGGTAEADTAAAPAPAKTARSSRAARAS